MKSLLNQNTLIPLGSILVIVGAVMPLVWSHASDCATAAAERTANVKAIEANRSAIDEIRSDMRMIRRELTDIRESQIRVEEHLAEPEP